MVVCAVEDELGARINRETEKLVAADNGCRSSSSGDELFGSGRGWWVMLTYGMKNEAVGRWQGGVKGTKVLQRPSDLTQCSVVRSQELAQ